nr:MAG: hypothetical protein [Microvirus sp.]
MKFIKPYQTPAAIANETGSAIYEWQYINDNGDVVTEKKDMYAYIQSFQRLTNYKEFIDENGNLDPVFYGNNAGIYCDVSPIPNDYSDLDNYIGNLVSNLRAAIAEEQAKTVAKPIEKSAQDSGQNVKTTTQATDAK